MGGGGHGADAQVGILHGAQLPLQQHLPALLKGPVNEAHRVAHVGLQRRAVAHQLVKQRLWLQQRLVVEVLQQDVFQGTDVLQLTHEPLLIIEVGHLNPDFGVLVGIEGCDARLGGAESSPRQALLLIAVQQHMIAHQKLGTLIHDDMGGGHTAVGQMLQLGQKLLHVQGHTVADDVGGMRVKDTRGQLVERKFAVVTDDGVPGVGPALKADDHIGRLGQEIGDLSLALVAPVCANDCFDHSSFLLPRGFAHWPFPARNRPGGHLYL